MKAGAKSKSLGGLRGREASARRTEQSLTAGSNVPMTKRVYLDWNATAPLRPQARAAMLSALEAVGNPSSVHAEGRTARRLVEQAREEVAALFAVDARQITFTSG